MIKYLLSKKNIKNKILLLILLLAILTRFWHLANPPQYIFDEVYHAISAQAYAQNDPAGYEWWHQSPIKGTAYEWLHPPIAKLFMAGGILLFGNNSFGWRFFSAVFGVLAIWLFYLTGKKLFDHKTGLIAAFLGAIDGLFLVMSRIAMNDIFLAVFVLASIYFLAFWYKETSKNDFDKKTIWLIIASYLFAGLAVATKWSGVFLLPIIALIMAYRYWQKNKILPFLKKISLLFFFGFLLIIEVYLLSYSQWWWQGHSFSQFIELHKQIWGYQIHLKATHGYGSKAWTWPVMIRPVWFFADYKRPEMARNIYNLGNPLIAWLGLVALAINTYQMIKTRSFNYVLTIFGFLVFLLPWFFSPRVMFLHHYLPAYVFLILGLAKVFSQQIKYLTIAGLFLLSLAFVWFYPYWTAIAMAKWYWQWVLWLPSWK